MQDDFDKEMKQERGAQGRQLSEETVKAMSLSCLLLTFKELEVCKYRQNCNKE